MKIGGKLKSARLAKGFSIYKLSKITYISQNHISAIENDKRQPTLETLERLVEPLGITLVELLNSNEEAFYLTSEEKNLIKNYRAMSCDNSELFLKLSSVLSNHNK